MDYGNQQYDDDAADEQQWPHWQQPQQQDMVIDPQLLENGPRVLGNVGSWPNSEEGQNVIASPDQIARDIDGSGDIQMSVPQSSAPPQEPQVPSFTITSTDEANQWQTPRKPQRRYPTRNSSNVYNMLPTPESSAKSHQQAPNANIYQPYPHTWQHGNAFGPLSLDTADVHQGWDATADDVIDPQQCPTPTSQQRPGQYFDAGDAMVSTPRLGIDPQYHQHDSPHYQSHQQGAPANFQLWGQQHATAGPPTDNIVDWTQGTFHLANLPGAPPPGPKGKGKKKASATPSHQSGLFPCRKPDCDKHFDTKTDLDHHSRYHETPTKQCPLCPKAFHDRKDLRRHMKSHSEERHLFCNYIDCKFHLRGFKRKDHLDRHVRNQHKREEAS